MEAVLAMLRPACRRANTRQCGDMRGLRGSLDQRGQVAFRLGLRVFLNRLAAPNHKYDSPRRPVLAHGDRGQNRDHRENIDTDVAVAQIIHHADNRVYDCIRDQRDDDVLAQ